MDQVCYDATAGCFEQFCNFVNVFVLIREKIADGDGPFLNRWKVDGVLLNDVPLLGQTKPLRRVQIRFEDAREIGTLSLEHSPLSRMIRSLEWHHGSAVRPPARNHHLRSCHKKKRKQAQPGPIFSEAVRATPLPTVAASSLRHSRKAAFSPSFATETIKLSNVASPKARARTSSLPIRMVHAGSIFAQKHAGQRCPV